MTNQTNQTAQTANAAHVATPAPIVTNVTPADIYQPIEGALAQSGGELERVVTALAIAKASGKLLKGEGSLAFVGIANETLKLALSEGVDAMNREYTVGRLNEPFTIKKLAQSFMPILGSLVGKACLLNHVARQRVLEASLAMANNPLTQVKALSGGVRAIFAKKPSGDTLATLCELTSKALGFADYKAFMNENKRALSERECFDWLFDRQSEASEGEASEGEGEGEASEGEPCPIEQAFSEAKQALLSAISHEALEALPSALEAFTIASQERSQWRALQEQERNEAKQERAKARLVEQAQEQAAIAERADAIALEQAKAKAKRSQERANALKALSA